MNRGMRGLRVPLIKLGRIPFRFCLLVVLALHLIGEEYPFSPFPMYSNFHNDARVVWIADQDGHPLATSDHFGLRASTIKKVLDQRARELAGDHLKRSQPVPSEDELERQAAVLVLEELWTDRRPERLERAGVTSLQLMEQTIWFADDRLQETEQVLAVRALPPPTRDAP